MNHEYWSTSDFPMLHSYPMYTRQSKWKKPRNSTDFLFSSDKHYVCIFSPLNYKSMYTTFSMSTPRALLFLPIVLFSCLTFQLTTKMQQIEKIDFLAWCILWYPRSCGSLLSRTTLVRNSAASLDWALLLSIAAAVESTSSINDPKYRSY